MDGESESTGVYGNQFGRRFGRWLGRGLIGLIVEGVRELIW